jgi:hypothetical protein
MQYERCLCNVSPPISCLPGISIIVYCVRGNEVNAIRVLNINDFLVYKLITHNELESW